MDNSILETLAEGINILIDAKLNSFSADRTRKAYIKEAEGNGKYTVICDGVEYSGTPSLSRNTTIPVGTMVYLLFMEGASSKRVILYVND